MEIMVPFLATENIAEGGNEMIKIMNNLKPYK